MNTKDDSNKAEVINFGCRLNAYESESIKKILSENKVNDILVFNTCSVTKEAERQARQAIRKAKRNNPDKRIIVTGCAAQTNPDQFKKMPEVDTIIGNAIKYDPNLYINDGANKDGEKRVFINDIMLETKVAHNPIISSFEDKTRGFLQVQNGCNHRCTFCIIPFGRGNSRSVEPRRVVEEAKAMRANGYLEIVLTGVDTTSYGADFDNKISLGQLCKMILSEVNDLPRLRLSSIDVAEIDEDILDLLANEKRFMPYLHISIQSGDNLILKRMKRRHTREMVMDFCNKVKKMRPDVAFGSDIIAGFPTESEEMFKNTSDLLKSSNIVYNHVFTFSPRSGTPAARMPQVDHAIRKERTSILINQTKEQMNSFLKSMIGTKQSVLIEKDGIGRCENFAPVKLTGEYGKIINVKITNCIDGFLIADNL